VSERGSASLYAVALLSVLLVTTAALAWVGGLMVAHRRAESAADLSALAGAVRPGAACRAAEVAADRNGASLTACRESAGHVWVTVKVPGPGFAGLRPLVLARAHAGPDP